MYQRKTIDVYDIVWNGEVVDETEDRKNAIYLKNEYNMAFGGGCSIKKTRQNKGV